MTHVKNMAHVKNKWKTRTEMMMTKYIYAAGALDQEQLTGWKQTVDVSKE